MAIKDKILQAQKLSAELKKEKEEAADEEEKPSEIYKPK